MKIRQKNVCSSCRARKLGCDGKLPTCSQCNVRGRECPGYDKKFVFLVNAPQPGIVINQTRLCEKNEVPSPKSKPCTDFQSSKSQTGVQIRVSGSRSGVIDREPRQWLYQSGSTFNLNALSRGMVAPLEELILLIQNYYVPEKELSLMINGADLSHSRICGAWVEVLPMLAAGVESNEIVLSSAIRALCLSILNKDPERRRLNSDFHEEYCSALVVLREGLPTYSAALYSRVLAASMCLVLAEIIFPSSDMGWRRHVRGIGDIMQILGPHVHNSGTLFKLFIGFRPPIILELFMSRKSTFMASKEWLRVPFTTGSVSPMQKLLSHAAILPSLLEKTDLLFNCSFVPTQSDITPVYVAFKQALKYLQEGNIWEGYEISVPLYWLKKTDNILDGQNTLASVPIWFPNILVANTISHLWAFQIVSLIHIAKLEQNFPSWTISLLRESDQLPDEIVERPCIFELSKNICLSMEYQMQNEMKLYGPASIFFPLRTAMDVFALEQGRCHDEIILCESIIMQLVARGIYLRP